MPNEEVICPECGRVFASKRRLEWHMSGVHAKADEQQKPVFPELKEPKMKIFGKEIKPHYAEIDAPSVTPSRVFFSLAAMIGWGFICFFAIRWIWSLGLTYFYGPIMTTLAVGYVELWFIKRFISVISKPIKWRNQRQYIDWDR